MNELKAKADEAWAAMVVPEDVFTRSGLKPGPMAPDIALDMVQDVTGDRDEAVTALLQAASDWLNTLRMGAALRGISADSSEVHTGNAQDAERVTAYIRGESLGLAMTHLVHIHERSRRGLPFPGAEARACLWWKQWEEKASLALKLCRQMIEAAHPAA